VDTELFVFEESTMARTQLERNAGRGDGGLTTVEREELGGLRRENRQLRLEQESLSKAAAWFARET
jgi:transposase